MKLSATLLATMALLLAGATATQARPDAGVSIIGGQATSISKWPWQVALAMTTDFGRGGSPAGRQFCGGSLVAPTMVVTAAHCALPIVREKPKNFSVIVGRSRLNDTSTGAEVAVKQAYVPRDEKGRPLFSSRLDWDVGLVELAEPVTQAPIKLAGPDEQSLMRPGRPVIETGWGTTDGSSLKPQDRLLMGMTTIQRPSVCQLMEGRAIRFAQRRQLCMGDSRGRSSACYGDSGGSAAVATDDGYRLVGAMSFVYGVCGFPRPMVDAAVARPDLSSWIRGIVLEKAGVDPVGEGADAGPLPKLCLVPKVQMISEARATRLLRRAGCERIKRTVRRWRPGSHGRRFDGKASVMVLPGWLWDTSRPIRLELNVWKPTPRRGR